MAVDAVRLDLVDDCADAFSSGVDLLRPPHRGARVDVVPGAHLGAAVDGYGSHGSVGENEPQGEPLGQVEFGYDGLEVVTIGAEPV